ncbi:hypothetical protein EV652_105117 [Kribbella steppae]|uniref:Uncharacterized protein n=1 Tax=Kribbella steppae TaxID=2512223 RepID=A0A4R2HJW2_9ACTN|nr:hypothetical protein [Kribbella steppae]TCO30123.1 hypothetical protein EV652_105117 [Kribbella steppae]
MAWQLWVVIALIATGVVILAVTRMRHAQHVFTDITRLDDPTESGLSSDDIARARARATARQAEAEASLRRRGHG